MPKLKFTKEEAEEASQDEVKILEEPEVAAPKKNELEMSIASITDNKSSDNVSAVANLLQSAADSDRKRTVISQEETEKAVNAMLGESFDSFQGAADPANKQQVENMDEDVANVADDEAAAAVAGLAALGSPENTEETSPAKEPATARRKSRDVFDFPDDEEEAAKPASIATSKVSPAAPSVENIIEEAVKADTKPQQTRVLPISRTAPPRTTSVTLTTASTLITPVSIVTTAPSSPAPVAAAEAATQSPLQPLRLSIDEKLSPSVSSSSPLSRSPKQRMRRSTGGNSRESEEESAVTEQKIHLILEQAKQEAERSAAAAAHHRPVVTMAGLHAIPMNLIAAGSQPELLIDPKTGQAVRGGVAGPSSSVTLSLVTSAAPPQAQAAQPEPARLVASGAKASLPQPKEVVLPPRNDQQVPRPTTRVVPAAQVPPAAAVRQPLPIQLPIQLLPPESVRKTQPPAGMVRQLQEMGFDKSRAERSLELHHNCLDAAIEHLIATNADQPSAPSETDLLQANISSLNLMESRRTVTNGNCWYCVISAKSTISIKSHLIYPRYDAIADQIALHDIPLLPRCHFELRQAICDEMTMEKMPEVVDWVMDRFNGDWGEFNKFVARNRRAGTWVDHLMCSATALYLGIFYFYFLDLIGSLVFTIVKLRERVREGLCNSRSLKVHNLSIDLTLNLVATTHLPTILNTSHYRTNRTHLAKFYPILM